jgi:1A family penicillin-binding protein
VRGKEAMKKYVSFVRGRFGGAWWLVKIVAIVLLTIVAGFVMAIAGLYFFAMPDLDTLTQAQSRFSQTSVVYDRTGKYVLYELHGEENRKMVAHEDIPDSVRQATLAAEDDAFYSHYGIDPISVLRALKVNLMHDGIVQGGSTITQQLARNVFLDRRKTWHRKISEAVLALKIERNFTKDEILDLYLNSVPYGSNAYGIQAAAETFFQKDAKQLTLDEAVLLAALPKAPTQYSPYGNYNKELVERQRSILLRMMDMKMVTRTEGEQALLADTLKKVAPLKQHVLAPHFTFYVIEELEKRYGRGALEMGGWKIYTTLDYNLQKTAEEVVRSGAARNVGRGAENAALVAVDPKTGEVLAMVGSKDFFDTKIDGQVNVATRPRQPGSSFKPFAYAKAFEKGYQPETLLYDVPTNFGPDGSGKEYTPQNYDGGFHGLLPMRKTLANSLNIPAVQTLYLAGVQETIDLAHRLGITTLQDRSRYGLSLVLGGGEVRLLDMVAAFSVFANEGVRHPAEAVVRIVGPEGEEVYGPKQQEKERRVLDAEVARKINSILSDNDARSMVFGSNSPLAFPGHTVAAKTGTTQEFRDAWTVGYTSSLAVGVWAGNNDNRPMHAGADGVFVAAPIWRDFMDRALSRYPVTAFTPYQPVIIDKPMLGGSVENGRVRYYRKSSGKELSFEEAMRKEPEKIRVEYEGARHSVLYYVNRDDPLGPSAPDYSDPMLGRWERSLGHGGGEWDSEEEF